jgi:hypothetical protein
MCKRDAIRNLDRDLELFELQPFMRQSTTRAVTDIMHLNGHNNAILEIRPLVVVVPKAYAALDRE